MCLGILIKNTYPHSHVCIWDKVGGRCGVINQLKPEQFAAGLAVHSSWYDTPVKTPAVSRIDLGVAADFDFLNVIRHQTWTYTITIFENFDVFEFFCLNYRILEIFLKFWPQKHKNISFYCIFRNKVLKKVSTQAVFLSRFLAVIFLKILVRRQRLWRFAPKICLQNLKPACWPVNKSIGIFQVWS